MKNHYILNPGEFFVVQEIQKNRPDIELCIPVRDHGWDLLALKQNGSSPVKIQVKESRVYSRENSWHQLRQIKIGDADVFVFVSYVPVVGASRTVFKEDYVIIPRLKLEKICESKKCSQGRYSFYFSTKVGHLTESRDDEIDCKEFHRAWNLI
jgi:hypothetical protein